MYHNNFVNKGFAVPRFMTPKDGRKVYLSIK